MAFALVPTPVGAAGRVGLAVGAPGAHAAPSDSVNATLPRPKPIRKNRRRLSPKPLPRVRSLPALISPCTPWLCSERITAAHHDGYGRLLSPILGTLR